MQRHLPRLRFALATSLIALFCAAAPSHASIGLVVGEPFGSFGTMMPNGHANIYLDHLCVETPTHLRPCLPGEHGAVLSRYHDLRHPALDWLAFPASTFFYGVDDVSALPRFVTPHFEAILRERYWSEHLREQIPGRRDRQGELRPPSYGDWEEGIGAAMDRRLFLYVMDTTPEQDAAILQFVNDSPNRRRYTLGRANCADFAADLLRVVLPPSEVHRNVWADFDMTTPKFLARQMDAYGTAHPEANLRVFEIPQLPGSLRRSRPLRGAAETFIKTKRYLVALLVLQPEVVVASWAVYEKSGKWTPGLDAATLTPGDWGAISPARNDAATATAQTGEAALSSEAGSDSLP